MTDERTIRPRRADAYRAVKLFKDKLNNKLQAKTTWGRNEIKEKIIETAEDLYDAFGESDDHGD